MNKFSRKYKLNSMKNLSDSEVLVTFKEDRDVFRPYGITCERWAPQTMEKFDRHNEIEINYIPSGSLSYFYHNRHITVPERKLSLFWGLLPHKIIDFKDVSYYYVVTIPLSVFLSWKLPNAFVNDVLNGCLLTDNDGRFEEFDRFMIDNWMHDIDNNCQDIMLLDIQSRLMRLSRGYTLERNDRPGISSGVNTIEKMAVYIAQNYRAPIKMSDIGEAAGLNPDYANSLFRKAFGHTLSEHVMIERITCAQRRLVSSDDGILQIAFDCGFNSISSFNKAFRRINGCTPREYRKINSVS